MLFRSGTLTSNTLTVGEVYSPMGLDSRVVLLLAAIAETHSTHPIAQAIKNAAPEFDSSIVGASKEIPGHGASVIFCGKRVTCGSKKLMESMGIRVDDYDDGILVAVDYDLVGCIHLRAEIRDDAQQAIVALRESGIGHIVMLTGDHAEAARQIAKEIDRKSVV